MKKLMVIGAGAMQIPLLQKAKDLGIFTIAIDGNDKAQGVSLCDLFYNVSTNDFKEVEALAMEHRVDGIITNSDYPVRVMASVSEKLQLKSLSYSASLLNTNKLLLREILQEGGIPSPRFFKVESEQDAEHFAGRLGYPFIMKPVDSSASRGVSLVRSAQEIGSSFAEARRSSRNGHVIVEAYVPGREFSVEAFASDNQIRIVAITEKLTTGAPHFVELGHRIPASLTADEESQIRTTVLSALRITGIRNGASHTEVKINDQGAFIIEIGPRLGGDYIATDLVPLATGYDMVENCLLSALSMPVREYAPLNKSAAIVFFTASSGIVTSIEGVEEALEWKQLVRLELTIKLGDQVNSLKSSLDRIGYAIVVGDTPEEADAVANAIKKQVVIRTESCEQ